MAAHERRTASLCAYVVIGLIALSCLCVTLTDALTVDEDGDILFDPLPSLGKFESDADAYESDGMRPAVLGDMARGWVGFIQPNGFPLDYVNHLIEILTDENNIDDIDVKDEVFLGMSKFIGIIVCFLIGILLFIFLPVIAFIFCCCRCCNNCGGKRVQEETKSMGCVRVTYTLILLCVTGIICAGMAYTNVDNDFMGHAVDKSFEVASDEILSDASTFLEGSDNQLTNILVDQYNDVDLQITEDLNDIGVLIGTPFQEYLRDDADVQETFDAFDKLILDLKETTMKLDHINNSRNELETTEAALETNLTDITTQLDAINVTCAGCVPSNDGLDVTDFAMLQDLSLNLAASRNVERNVFDEYAKVLQVYNSIPGVITAESSAAVDDVKQALSETKSTLDDTAQSFSDQISTFQQTIDDAKVAINDAKQTQQEYDQYRKKEKTEVTDWRSGIRAAYERKDHYNYYRRYTVIGLCCMVLLIVMFNIIGLTMGTCAYKNVAPVDRTRMSNAGGNVLVAGVVFTFLFIPVLILICCMMFTIMAVGTLTCKPMTDLSLFSETIDQNGTLCDGYCLGETLLGDPTINLTVSGVLESCGRNESLYSSLMLYTVFNTTIIDDQLEQLRNEAQKLIDEITLDDFDLDLVPDNFQQELQAAIDAIALETIDVLDFESILVPPPVPTDLNAYADELDQAANADPTVGDDLRNIADMLRAQHVNTVVPMEDLMSMTMDSVYRTAELDPILDQDADNTSSAAFHSEALINTPETEAALQDDVSDYLDNTIGYAEQYSDWALQKFEDDFARCEPVRNVYDTFVSTLCYYGFDSLNILWFTLGWCVFFLIPSIIFSIKLAKYYRIMDELYEPKPKKPKKNKSRRGEENYPMDEMDDMPPTGHGHHDNIRLVNDRGPPPMMAQQNPQYIPDEPIMAYHYNDLGRPMAPPPAYHPDETRLAENKAALIRELKQSNQGASASSLDHDLSQWPMRGVGPSQSSMLLPPYGYYPSINDAHPGRSSAAAGPSSSAAAAGFDPAWPHWGRQQAFEYDDDTRFPYPEAYNPGYIDGEQSSPEAYNPAFVGGGHSSTDDFGNVPPYF
ncbi:prominin-1-A-like [Amphiura filiformis]|uniref:prominin-1-A-like n=1 Tax=Amphiura filiformis TaxID=82378 RepID=UPI003B228976